MSRELYLWSATAADSTLPRRRRLRHERLSRRRALRARAGSVFLALGGVLLAYMAVPITGWAVAPVWADEPVPSQSLALGAYSALRVHRDGYTISAASVRGGYITVPSAPRPSSATVQSLALALVESRGWNYDQFSCLVSLWNKESGWNPYAQNRSSGAYGIPQALPGSKMASAGPDWQTNPQTQITWGLNYIGGRYGSPCGAYSHSRSVGWY